MNVYSYSGPVMKFDMCVANNWKGSTRAVSEKKAKSNLEYQFKRECGLTPNARIVLPGKLELVDDSMVM